MYSDCWQKRKGFTLEFCLRLGKGKMALKTTCSAVEKERLPEFDTNSMSFPSRISSSFWAVDTAQFTPEGKRFTFQNGIQPAPLRNIQKSTCSSIFDRKQNISITCSRLTSPHSDAADVFLSQEVPDLHQSSSLLDDDVDGEMGVHRAHFVPEALQSDRTRDAFRQKLNQPTMASQTAQTQWLQYMLILLWSWIWSRSVRMWFLIQLFIGDISVYQYYSFSENLCCKLYNSYTTLVNC